MSKSTFVRVVAVIGLIILGIWFSQQVQASELPPSHRCITDTECEAICLTDQECATLNQAWRDRK